MLQAWLKPQTLAVLLLEVPDHDLHRFCQDVHAGILEPTHHPSDLLDVDLEMLVQPLEWVEEMLALVLQCEVCRLHQISLGIWLYVAHVDAHMLGNQVSCHVVQDVE